MNNPFKKITTHYSVSKLIRSKVIDDVNMVKLSFKISDLFAKKHPTLLKDYYIKQEILDQKK